MNKLAAILILFIAPVAAQTKPDNNFYPGVRIYEPKYLESSRAAEVARFVSSLVPDIQVSWERVANAVVIRSTPTNNERLDQAEALLKRFDVPEPPPPPRAPRHDVEMTIHLVRAHPEKTEGSVPPELASVVKEMKGALPYGGFSLVDTIQLIGRDGLKVQDALPNWTSEKSLPRFYTLAFNGGPFLSGDGKTVSVGTFQFTVKVPVSSATGVTYQDEGITTPITISEGQKLVIGKIKPSAPSTNDDLFIVLSCKIK